MSALALSPSKPIAECPSLHKAVELAKAVCVNGHSNGHHEKITGLAMSARSEQELSELNKVLTQLATTATTEIREISIELGSMNTTVAVMQNQLSGIDSEVKSIKSELRGSDRMPAVSSRLLMMEAEIKRLIEESATSKANNAAAKSKAESRRWQIWVAIITAALALLGHAITGAITLIEKAKQTTHIDSAN